jgi:hypothetical protein
MLVDSHALGLEVLVEHDARTGTPQHSRERRLARLDRLTPQVAAVEL